MQNVKDFLNKVASDGELRGKFDELGGDKAGIVKLASGLGFSFSEGELAEAMGDELDLNALDQVVGGSAVPPITCLP